MIQAQPWEMVREVLEGLVGQGEVVVVLWLQQKDMVRQVARISRSSSSSQVLVWLIVTPDTDDEVVECLEDFGQDSLISEITDLNEQDLIVNTVMEQLQSFTVFVCICIYPYLCMYVFLCVYACICGVCMLILHYCPAKSSSVETLSLSV